MLRKNRLFTPGPTPLLPAAQTAMAAANIHHRTADFRALYARVLDDLRTFIGTRNDVIMMASSGSGAMEAAVTNLTSAGDKVLVLTAGKFGERWTELAKAYGCVPEIVSAPYGDTIDISAVAARLGPGIRVVYMQATESSTGARHDVEEVARLVRESGHDTLLVVDANAGRLDDALPLFKAVFAADANWRELTPRLRKVDLLKVSDDDLKRILEATGAK